MYQSFKEGNLHRNFMGYTPKSGVDLYGVGMSAISEFGRYFIQNAKELKAYQSQVADSGLSGQRGFELSVDDRVRKWVILRLICHFLLSFTDFKDSFQIDFKEYFAEELEQLNTLESDGLIEIHQDHIKVVKHGKILVRNVCMVFDKFINKKADSTRYSKTI